MVGKGVMLECLDHPDISRVIVINRKPVGIQHSKLEEIILRDFHDLTTLPLELDRADACFHCMGISALGKTEEDYTRVTHDITIDLAARLSRQNPDMVFCYVSGQGTNINGKAMWARVKGRTEKELTQLPFKKVVLFRPGYIQPLRGIRSSTGWYDTIYKVTGPLYPVLKKWFPNTVTNTTSVGKAMINCLRTDSHPQILTNADINKLAEAKV
jgi:uncharacterized protein YbjT (DUF2867 family)